MLILLMQITYASICAWPKKEREREKGKKQQFKSAHIPYIQYTPWSEPEMGNDSAVPCLL